MIVGTSTGALIAFALVGGKEVNGERQPMTCNEIIELYKELSPKIFPKSRLFTEAGILTRPCGATLRYLSPTTPPLWPYDPTQYVNSLHEHFGNATLSDFPKKCTAGRFYKLKFTYLEFSYIKCF